MRAIMVTPCYYPVRGGTETIVRNLSIALNRNGIRTDVMTFNVDQNRKPKWQGQIDVIDGITVYRIPALNWLWKLHSYKVTAGVNFIPGRFAHIIKNYDIIHFHEFDLSLPFFSSLIRKPKIIHLHGIDYTFLRKHNISRFLFRHLADVYISISKQMKRELLTLKIDKDKILYLPNSVDINLFKPARTKKEDNMLLFVGRISPTKGLHILLKSLKYLKKSVRLIIVGPSDLNSDYCQSIQKFIEKETRRKKHEIHYLGILEPIELVEWYQRASLLILPSFAEGFPVVILEALACETPVIATPVGGIPEIIKNYKTGILIQKGDCVSLAKAIQYLLENKDLRLQMGITGRKYVMKIHSLETASKILCNLYEKLTSIDSNNGKFKFSQN